MEIVSSSVDGVPIAYDVSGDGPLAVVFVHGLVGDHTDFDQQTEFFASTHQVVAVDLPGSGHSGHERTSWTMEELGEDVATVADHLDLADVVLVGHSLGGNVIVEAALRLGNRVRSLIWLSSFRSLDSFPTPSETEAWFTPFHVDPFAAVENLNRRNFGPNADPDLVDAVVAKAKTRDPQRVLELLESMFRHDKSVADAVQRIDAPVYAINPDFKASDESSFSRYGVELRLIEGVGHFLMMEAPDRLNNELQRIIGETLRSRT